MNNPQISNAAALLGRIFMSAIFITAGYGKIGGYAGASAYMAKMGVPAALLPLVILTELGGGLLILIGLLMVTGIWSQIMFSLQAVMANFGTIL